MGANEDGMHPFDINMPYNSPSTPVDYSPFSDSFEMPPYMPYPPPSNPDDLRQEVPPTSIVPTVVEFEQNLGSTSRMTAESFLDAEEMVFDINEDLEGTTVVQDAEVRVEAPRFGMQFDSMKDLTAYYK
ncbi:uncharacterized protein LOC121242379 [Juglans microcarpa x Juglans regia]|uniref:uncharacterized protein LOC121242379 n=1 Tax=Juglans microcarpa x Juglans regia TaxID=2249226 RepID=UPI001B7E835F|nr:uncharacterized protein LOC121242379 [Juglans microcarpa x Juglans regia]